MKTISSPLMLTKGKGADEKEQEREGEGEEQESEKEVEPTKKKGRVIITKPQKASIVVFTRRSKGKGKGEVVLTKPPLTFYERLKQMEEGTGIRNFKALKFETRTDADKMQIEELVLNKMGKWKYSPAQIAPQISKELLVRLQPRWESVVQVAKDIYEQSFRKLFPNLIDVKVKVVMKTNKGKMMIRFHTCFILIKYIEHVVRDATNMWKNIYHLHKPSDDPVEIKDDYCDNDEE